MALEKRRNATQILRLRYYVPSSDCARDIIYRGIHSSGQVSPGGVWHRVTPSGIAKRSVKRNMPTLDASLPSPSPPLIFHFSTEQA